MVEKRLSGYIHPEDLLNPEHEALLNSLTQTLPRLEPIIPADPVSLLTHIYLELTADQLSHSISQQKLDPLTSLTYHLVENPPPKDVKGL